MSDATLHRGDGDLAWRGGQAEAPPDLIDGQRRVGLEATPLEELADRWEAAATPRARTAACSQGAEVAGTVIDRVVDVSVGDHVAVADDHGGPIRATRTD